MKLLFDFFPIVLFFAAYKLHDDPKQGFITATMVIIVATAVQVAVFWARNRRVEKMHIVTLALVVAFGGLTIAFDNDLFFKWKPTIVNWLFAIAFLASAWIGEKNLVRRVMDGNIELPDPIWTRLNLAWVAFFAAMGVLNLYVVYSFDTDTWVNFKLFGLMGLTFLFVIAQGLYLMRHMPDEDAEETP